MVCQKIKMICVWRVANKKPGRLGRASKGSVLMLDLILTQKSNTFNVFSLMNNDIHFELDGGVHNSNWRHLFST